MAANFTNVYQKNIRGSIIQIGNTLGLSKDTNTNTPGALGSIGAFITTQTLTAAGGWPLGTTLQYTQNSSSAILNLPPNTTVDFAALIWSASHVVNGGNVTANIDDPINFTDSLGTTYNLTSTQVNQTSITLTEGGENSTNYVKSVDVTTIVAAAGSGTYTTGSVPCTMSPTSNFLQYAGWSLYVVYKDTTDTMTPKNLVIFIGSTVSSDVPYSVPANYPGPPYPIKICYTAGEGDAIITADRFNTRPAVGASVINIGTPVQPSNSNPFSSIIGDQSGGIDTTGTFGTSNQSGTAGTNIVAGRQGWDIANNIDISSAFTTAQPVINLDIGTNNDPAILLANGFIVDLAQPVATLTKLVDKTIASANDKLTYTLIYDFGTVPSGQTAANIVVVDTVPNGVNYIPGSVNVNGATIPSANPNTGINLTSLSAKGVYTITFNVTVDTVTQTQTIPNTAFASYNFITNGTTFTNTNSSNIVTTTIDPFNASTTKSVNKIYASIGDTLTYTITIVNAGATLNNVIFSDTVPSDTLFIPNSVFVNLIPQSGVTPSSVPLNSLSPNSFTTITFSAIVTTIPSPNPIKNSATIYNNYTLDPLQPNGASKSLNTNIVSTTVSTAILSSIKQTSKSYANIGDTITYSININNVGSATASNILFSDTIPNGTTFVTNSMTQGITPISGSPNPPGVILPNDIGPGGSSIVSFSVIVNTIPSPNPIQNSALQTYQFIVDPSTTPNRILTQSTNTNIVNTTVSNASLGNIVKGVNRAFVTCGDTLTYTISIPNTGNVTASNVILSDTVPNGTVFIPNSLLVNGTSTPGTPANIPLGNIAPGTTTTVSFSVKVQC